MPKDNKQKSDEQHIDKEVQEEQVNEVVEEKKEVKPCKKCGQAPDEIEKYKQGWQRAQADYQNLMREMDNKKSELVVWSKQMILEDFIPVYDNFKKAFEIADGHGSDTQIDADVVKKFENWKKGIEYIMKQYGDVLKKHGIIEMKTVGEQFDPTKHEALQEEESDEPEGTILKELDAGYMMGEKVVKVAKVVVAKAKE